MSWNEVAAYLKEINTKTEMGLHVLASSCFGLYLDTAITIKDQAPFYKSYGPNKKIEGDCIVRYNSALIRDFIEDNDLSQTIEQENSEPNKTNAVYMACDCVQLYKKVATKYYKECLLAQNVVVRGIINMSQIEVVAKERGETIEETLKNYICMLLNKEYNESLFYKFMDRFLMTDKNSPYALERASLTFDECWTDAWRNSYKEFEMENTVEVGSVSGKKLYRSPVKNADYSELEKYFSVFSFMELALTISKLAKNVYCANDVLPNINGTAYNDDILCRALELAIKYASKDKGKAPNEQDIVNILQYAAGEAEKYQFSDIPIDKALGISSTDAEIIAMRIAYTQFSENSYNLISRYWYLFAHLWTDGRESAISPLDDLNKLIGISYKELIVYGILLSDKPFAYSLDEEEKKEIAICLKDCCSDNGFQNFIDYFSCCQDEWTCFGIPPICNLKPLVKTNQACPELNKIVYFAPAKYKLMSRITSGLYFDLCDKYKGEDKKNPFKQEFGEVFEKYVGEILKHSLTSYTVSSEIVYKEGKNEVKSVDFFVKKDENLVLIY